MAGRADLVNEALEASVPLQYPEDVVESMRSGFYNLIAPPACQSQLLQHSSLCYNSTKHSLYIQLPKSHKLFVQYSIFTGLQYTTKDFGSIKNCSQICQGGFC